MQELQGNEENQHHYSNQRGHDSFDQDQHAARHSIG